MDIRSESHFKRLREELDGMGYHQPLSFESVPLVEKLLSASKNCQSSLNQCNKMIRLKKRKIFDLNAALKHYQDEFCALKKNNEVLSSKWKFEKDSGVQLRKKLKNQITELENKVLELEFVSSEQNILLNECQDRFNSPSLDCTKQRLKNMNLSDLKGRCGLNFANLDLVNEFIFNLLTVRDGVTQEVKSLKRQQNKLHGDLKLSRSKPGKENETNGVIESGLNDGFNMCCSGSCHCYCKQIFNSHYKDQNESKFLSTNPAKGKSWSMKKKILNNCAYKSEPIQKNDQSKVKGEKDCEKTAFIDSMECSEKQNESLPKDLIEERDYYYREYQRIKDKILILLKDNHPSVGFSDCPHDGLELLEEMLSVKIGDKNDQPDKIKAADKQKSPSGAQNVTIACSNNEFFGSDRSNYNSETLSNQVTSLQNKCDSLKINVDSLTKEVLYYKLNNNDLKLLLEKTEYNLQTLRDAKRKTDFDLQSALSKLENVVEQKNSIEKKKSLLDMEKESLSRNLKDLDSIKDSISHDLDIKSEEIRNLNEQLRNERITREEFKQQLCTMKENFRRAEETSIKLTERLRIAEAGSFKSDLKIKELKDLVKQLTAEKSCLKQELDLVQSSFLRSTNEIRMAKCEIEDLKSKMQTYVSEVRQIEDLLQSKETERHSLLLQLKGFNDKDCPSTSKINHCSALSTETINDLQDRLHSYEKEVYDKDEMLLNMKTEIEMLKEKVERFELEGSKH